MTKKPLKICILAAAGSSHTYLQCGILRDFGHEVTLVSPDDGQVPDGVTHISCAVENKSGLSGKLKWLLAVYDRVKSVQADVYHAHYAAELTTWMASLLNKRPFVISCLGGDVLFEEQGTQGPIGQWMTKQALRKCDQVTVVSNFLGDEVERFGIARTKIQRVVWGVNRKVFYPKETARLWDVAEDARVIFSPRMLKPFYNQIMMLDILKDVVVKEPKAVLVFATYNQDPAYRAEIEARTKELELEDHVKYAPPMDQQEMAQAYNCADLVLSLSPSDGTPVSVMEAMACGTPVVMANLDRYKEFFTHKESGWFTPIEPDAVIEALTTLLSDQQLYQTLKTNGQKVVEEKADLHSQSRLLEEMSYRLIDQS